MRRNPAWSIGRPQGNGHDPVISLSSFGGLVPGHTHEGFPSVISLLFSSTRLQALTKRCILTAVPDGSLPPMLLCSSTQLT